MSEIRHGGPAFPIADPFALEPANVMEMKRIASGMTLRDKFAESALIGLLSEPIGECQSTASYMTRSREGDQPGDLMARAAYLLADAMLRAREA
ncbi:MAG: hypothetical protein KGQ57_10710 [Burkholderiales bacterium]|nr:hypothetical protein [Burkholderiales bacterium]